MNRLVMVIAFFLCIPAATFADGAVPMGKFAAVSVLISDSVGTTYTVRVSSVDATTTKVTRQWVDTGKSATILAPVPRLMGSGHLDPQNWYVRVLRARQTGEAAGVHTVNYLAVRTADPLTDLLATKYQDFATSESVLTSARAHAMRVYWQALVAADAVRQKAAQEAAQKAAMEEIKRIETESDALSGSDEDE